MDDSGNVRAGFLGGGALLVVLGLGGGLMLNLLLHSFAPSSGIDLFLVKVYPGWSLYASLVAVGGIVASIIGMGMLWVGFDYPPGPIGLPDPETPPG